MTEAADDGAGLGRRQSSTFVMPLQDDQGGDAADRREDRALGNPLDHDRGRVVFLRWPDERRYFVRSREVATDERGASQLLPAARVGLGRFELVQGVSFMGPGGAEGFGVGGVPPLLNRLPRRLRCEQVLLDST